MLFHYQKIRKVTEVLNDLIKIHNDRIACYQQALSQSTNLSEELRSEFAEFISESVKFKEQLISKIMDLNGHATKGSTILGKIYGLWTDLKVALAYNTE